MKYFNNKKGMTFIEIIIVTSLVAMISLAIYNALSIGLKVWQRNQQSVMEENIVIFFEKLTEDLHNSFEYSIINFKGNEFSFAFPTIVKAPADKGRRLPEGTYIEEPGKVEYYYDLMKDEIFRREAVYGKAIKERFGPSRLLASSISRVKFSYFYLTDKGEVYSSEILDIVPAAVSVEVEFSDKRGKRVMRKLIEVPVGN